MNISTSSYDAFRVAGVEGGIRLIAEAGFDSIDLDLGFMLSYTAIVEGKSSKYLDMSDDELCEMILPYRDMAEKCGVTFGQAHGVYPTYVPNEASNANVVRMLEKQIMLCEFLRCPYLIVHPGTPAYSNPLSEQALWDFNIGLYSQLIPAIKRHKTIVCLENMFIKNNGKAYAGTCADPDEACRYIDTLNEIAGEKCFAFCLDTGHALLTSHELGNVIRKLGHRLETLHLNDNDGADDFHYMPYMGRLDWTRLCDLLREIGYKNALNFELIMSNVDNALVPDAMRFVHAAGKMFESRILGE